MKRRSVVFAAPYAIEVEEDQSPEPKPGSDERLVRTLVSAISAGTELHFYRGDLDDGIALDESLPALGGSFRYPARYGYAAVGELADGGARVFSFQPHASHFVAAPDALHVLPADASPEAAALWPSVETAVNLALDARPLIGERVLVVGQGVVGLLATFVLSRFPLARLWTVDPLERRRDASLLCGAERALAPEQLERAETELDFDLVVELSGRHRGLELGIQAAGAEGRVVVGSWYGDKPRELRLGTHFHRGRVSIESSQVSHLAPRLRARWDTVRRLGVAGALLPELPLDVLVTHRFPVERAAEAYALVDKDPESCLQVLLTYT